MVTQYLTTIGLALFSLAGPMFGATLIVGKSKTSCPNAQYSAIADAVKAANAGDEIDICPGLYADQLVITKPLTLRGIEANGQNLVLIQPALNSIQGLPFQAVITVMNTTGVNLENLTVDASNNTVSGCGVGLSGVHFFNASGSVNRSTVIGARLGDPLTCKVLFPGNGAGIQVDSDGTVGGPFQVFLTHNTIHDFSRNGILLNGSGITAEVDGNQISGTGPSLGVSQFGVFIALGAVGVVTRNVISQGACGTLSNADCVAVRSEGVVLRAVGDGTIVDRNIISNVQSGIFINGGNAARVTNNIIRNVDALDGIDIQGTASGFFSNSVIEGNTISNVGPIDDHASKNSAGWGINEFVGTGVAGNILRDNTVTDAYCGIAYTASDFVGPGVYSNTLYTVLNADLYPDAFPPVKLP